MFTPFISDVHFNSNDLHARCCVVEHVEDLEEIKQRLYRLAQRVRKLESQNNLLRHELNALLKRNDIQRYTGDRT